MQIDDRRCIQKEGTIHLVDGVWKMTEETRMSVPGQSTQQVPQVLAQAEAERADRQQDRERLKKAREAVLAAAMHLEEGEIPDGIKRSWGIQKT